MKLEFFIIRNKHTGWYLPPGIGRDGRGTTHQDLIEPCEAFPPKLFHTRAAAAASLRRWLRGKTSVSRRAKHRFFDDDDVYESWHTEPCPDRNIEDMEVAKVELHL